MTATMHVKRDPAPYHCGCRVAACGYSIASLECESHRAGGNKTVRGAHRVSGCPGKEP